jgi:hypothetical protein
VEGGSERSADPFRSAHLGRASARGKENGMATFKVVTPAGTSYGAPGADYELEMEGLGPVGAEIVEIPAGT